jgi:hypothetical protein
MQRQLIILLLPSLAACRSERVPSVGGSASGADVTAGAREASGASALSSPPNPFAAHALAPEQRRWLEGSVEEMLPAGSYVYLRVRAAEAPSVWVASLAATTPSPPLERVRVLVLGHAEHFHSRRLARDFSPLAFGVVRAETPERAPSSKGTEL